MKEIILIGGGGHCRSCIDVIELGNEYKIAGILDVKEKTGHKILDYTIIGTDDEIVTLSKSFRYFLITLGQIGSPGRRLELYNFLKKNNIALPVIISPLAYVSKYAKIGEGTVVLHHALVNSGAVIGSNCIINSKALIEHDVIIGDHCHISTGAIVNGGVKIGNKTFFGSNAVCREYIEIPGDSFIKANSLVK